MTCRTQCPPYGDCSLIRMADLNANVLQVGRDARTRSGLTMGRTTCPQVVLHRVT
jgi:hypothetical protein